MKYIKTLILALIVIALLYPQPQALEAIGQLGVGVMVQKNMPTEFGYAVGFNIPTASKEGVYELSTEITYIYADKTVEGLYEEVEAIRTAMVTKRELYKGLFAKVGAGFWNYINIDGDDEEFGMIILGFGYTRFGVEFNIACDLVRQPGPDIYFPSVSVKLLTL